MELANLNNSNASDVFGSMSGGIKKRLSSVNGLMHQQLAFQHASALNQQNHENLMQHAGVVHAHNVELENVRHQNVSQLSAQEHAQTLEQGNAAHGRQMEFIGALRKHAEPGTEMSLQHGDVKANFTLKNKTRRAPKAAAEQVAPEMTPEKKTGPSVTRDPKTGRIRSLKK